MDNKNRGRFHFKMKRPFFYSIAKVRRPGVVILQCLLSFEGAVSYKFSINRIADLIIRVLLYYLVECENINYQKLFLEQYSTALCNLKYSRVPD